MDILHKLGRQIQKYRKSRGLTQEMLAERTGLHRTYIGAIERGERNLTIENLNKIATALDTPLFELFRFE